MKKSSNYQFEWQNNNISILRDILAPPFITILMLISLVALTTIVSFEFCHIFGFNWRSWRVNAERYLDESLVENAVFIFCYLILILVILKNRRRFQERFLDYISGCPISTVILSVVAGAAVGGVYLILNLIAYAAKANSLLPTSSIDVGVFHKASLAPQVNLAILIIKVSIIGPIAEELYFRRIIYVKLRESLNVNFSVLISGFIFVTAHIFKFNNSELSNEILDYIGIFTVGIVCSILLEKKNSILPSIFFHAANNGVLVSSLFF